MDIRNELMELQENFNKIDSRFRQLWDTLLDDEDGISGETYCNLKSLGEVISPIFTQDASRRVESSDNRWYLIGKDYA